MKRFEFAAEIPKQLITLSAALIAVSVTFLSDVAGNSDAAFIVLLFAWFFWLATIVLGILVLGALTNLAEDAELHDAKKPLVPSLTAQLQISQSCAFACGLVFFILTTIVSRLFD